MSSKISQLPDGGALQGGDLVPIDRGGANFSVTGANLAPPAVNPPIIIPNGYQMLTASGSIGVIGNAGLNEAVSGSTSTTAPTGSEYPKRNYTSSATANSGCTYGELNNLSPGQAGCPIARLYRYSCRVALSSTTNIRAWVGMGDFNNSISTSFFGTNPNGNMVAFRYVAGVDTHWVAYVGTATATFTAVDTGITPSTSALQELRIDFSANGTVATFYINGVQVAQINTTVPVSPLRIQGSVDNLNTANAVTLSWGYLMRWSQ